MVLNQIPAPVQVFNSDALNLRPATPVLHVRPFAGLALLAPALQKYARDFKITFIEENEEEAAKLGLYRYVSMVTGPWQ